MTRPPEPTPELPVNTLLTSDPQTPPRPSGFNQAVADARTGFGQLQAVTTFLDEVLIETETALDPLPTNPNLNMILHLVRAHLQGKTVTPTGLVAAARVPYATGMRKLAELQSAGLIEERPRGPKSKRVTLHPSESLLQRWTALAGEIARTGRELLTTVADDHPRDDGLYFGASYGDDRVISPPRILLQPLDLAGGLRTLVHGDPTFMVMRNLRGQFEQMLGCTINQRAYSIDRLHAEIMRNAERPVSQYDIIAFDMPWVGELAEGGVILPLQDVLSIDRLDPGDFHTAGWGGAHFKGRAYGVPAQTTPELLFYRTDLFAEAGLAPPDSIDALLNAAKTLHDPSRRRYGIAWNAAKGTPLGHTFLMACADFGQPVVDLKPIAGGFDGAVADPDRLTPLLLSDKAEEAAEFLLELMQYSPPNILTMSWYERIKPYAAGEAAMAYGYTLLAPLVELAPESPANGRTGYLPHPPGPGGLPIAPVGGYLMGIPANIAPERKAAAAEALIAFTGKEAQKLYVQNGSRTVPRYSVGADPTVARLSPIFEAVDGMSARDELQFWPRPPIPQIAEIVSICGEEMHPMLRGMVAPRVALERAQARVETLFKSKTT